MHLLLEIFAWGVALVWLSRAVSAYFGLPKVADLRGSDWDVNPASEPTLTVIIPARNEAADVGACVESLLSQDYGAIEIVAVNDRSTDETGAILNALAAAHPDKMRVLHVRELPSEWLGKTHAMALAARDATSEFLLFTDADILFEPSALRRALAHAVATNADHMVLMPTTIIHRWDEAALLSFFQIFGLWAVRPWRVADPRAKRDAIGVGAFNLLRRSAYEQVGGFEALRMEIVEDLGMGRRIKQSGLRQRVAFGRGLVSVHWASGVPGLIDVMTKNVFAATKFQPALAMGGCLWLVGFCIAPLLLLWTPGYQIAGVVTVGAIAWAYIQMGRISGLSGWNFFLAPFAAGVFVYTLLRSMVTTLRQGGVVWRGTFYSLKELKRHLQT